ncbi:hypothetical protein B0H66DRAFT_283822 [Apodospora peruviana]|uniref:Uncharacterized protein n=1 Tax=Apodospora peruviana TaxID=516989 RepID=A0AAE0M297_9PEZI|nr:hypothetical protein B0H66DRAFT_283822 [Apodospora peruviana]
MSATTTAPFPLGTVADFPGADSGAGDPNSGPAVDGSTAGASGTSSSDVGLSRGGLIAIIVVVVVVAVFGILSGVLFFVAKKREWQVRATIRKSARKVVDALTPRRSEFPKSVKESHGRSGRMKLDEVPPTPRIKPEHLDIEKGLDTKKKQKRNNFSRK